MMVDRH